MSSDRARTFFDGYAGDFDAIYNRRSSFGSRVVNHIFRRSMQLRYLKTLEGCHPIEGKTVLDVGCGPGHYSISLAQRGAAHVVGIDFAGGMLRLATEHARQAGVAGRCEFREADFLTFISEPFDYLILMGFMDYIPEPERVIEKVLSLTRSKAFLSFPVEGGFIAWQRRLRYRKRCDLFLYTRSRLEELFSLPSGIEARIESIRQDFFVTVSVSPNSNR